MRVCFISRRFFPAISGMSVYALNLLRELVAAGHDVTMISQYRADPAGAGVYGGGPPPAVPGVQVVGLESVGERQVCDGKPADFEADIERMVRAAEEWHAVAPFDLVHAQYGYPNGLAALEAGRRLGLPTVVSIQGGDGHWVGTCCRTHRDAMRAVLLHADAVLIGSESFAEEVMANHGVPRDVFTVVPGGTDTVRFAPRDEACVGCLSDPPTLLYHGRVDCRKGLCELLDAFAALVGGGRDLRLVVSGIGPDVQLAKDRAAELGVGGRVAFTGYASYDDAPRAYHRGDVFVSPTYSEGFSNTILEAMASGLPIVSTRAVGVVDCLRHERDALLVEPKDVAGLAAAVARLLDDGELRRRLACRALADVRRLYSWPAVGRQIMAVYDRVADRKPSAGWLELYDPRAVTVGTADPGCRFRAAPHLL
jgi:glycosyltransferase involved in cell wall biosynthesis